MDKRIVEVLEKNYIISKKIGKGGFGSVYELKSRSDPKKLFACKISEDRSAFHEYNIIKHLPDRFFVRVIDGQYFDGEPGRSLMIMDKYSCDLRRFLQITPNFQLSLIKKIMLDLLFGLRYLRSMKLIHGDLKPGNILLNNEQGMVKARISDFGLSKLYVQGNRNSPEIQTRNFRAPEICFGYEFYGYEVDIWSLGCIFFELFSKEHLFNSVDVDDYLHSVFELCGFFTKRFLSEMAILYPKLQFAEQHFIRNVYVTMKFVGIPENFAELLDFILVMDPKIRPTADEILKHPVFYNETVMKILN